MHHLCAYSESIAQNAFNDLAPVPDGVLTIANSHFLPQRDLPLVFAAAMSANLARARIVTPNLRLVSTPFIRPIINAAIPGNDAPVQDFRRNPLVLKGLEEVAIEAIQTGAAAERVNVLLGLQFRDDPIPAGDPYTIRWTGTTAAVADTWTQITPTFDQVIPAGVYALTWAEVFGTGLYAHRYNIENQVPRPGFYGQAAVTSQWTQRIPWQGLGEWGRFRSTAMPIIEVLCNAATASWEGYMTIIRVAALSY